MTKDELYQQIVSVVHDTFEIDRDKIRPEARLYEDLDIDSIDAVDLIVRMKSFTGKRLHPDAFKNVRTVDDVVTALDSLMAVK